MTLPAGEWSVGATLAPHTFTVTRADLRRYAAASGDPNPVHLDDSVAQAAGFDGVIAHGMLTLALAGRALEQWAGGAGRVRDLRAKFTRPVLVPDDEQGAVVQVGGVVRSVEPRDDGLGCGGFRLSPGTPSPTPPPRPPGPGGGRRPGDDEQGEPGISPMVRAPACP